MRNFQFQYHPRCLEGSLTPDQAVAEVEEGLSLQRAGAPTVDDLLDYWAFIGYKLSEQQFEYCVTNTFPQGL